MDVYMYQAALLCEDCGRKTRLELKKAGKAPADPRDETSYDSDDYPKGPYADGGGESDSPGSCDQCGVFLENDLTEEGIEYVKDLIAQHFSGGRGDKKVLKEWADFYDIDFKGAKVAKKNPPGTTGWRGYGPGKYDSVVDSYVHALDGEGWGDEEIGDVADFGWYGLMSGDPGFLMEPDAIPRIAREGKDELTPEERRQLKETVGVIIHESDSGSVGITYYKSEKQLKKAWEELAAEAEEFYAGVEE